jgi:osmotically-inducible protein OsmY
MANRQQDNQPGMQRGGDYRAAEDEDTRYSRDYDRDYGQSVNPGERDNSVRSANFDQGRGRYGRPDTGGQSGSTGRYPGYGNFGQGDYSHPGRGPNTGQDRYGQTGYGQGGYGQGNYGQPNYSYGQPSYGQEAGSSGTSNYGRSNFGSGRADRDASQGWREPSGEGQQYDYGGTGLGGHRGKGPKNYQRSDERIREMLSERLHDDPNIDASEVTVTVQGGRITLEGTVDSRQTKNAIEDVAEQLGTQDVQNNLRVQKAGQQASETGGKSTSGRASEEGELSKTKRN